MRERIKKIFKLLIVNSIVFLSLIFIIEVYARLFVDNLVTQGIDSEIILNERYGVTDGLKPLSSGYVFGHLVEIDSEGYIKRNCQKSTKKKKVLTLGDSMTMGVGVDQGETYGGLLSKHYCETHKIDNLSITGYNINDYLRILQAKTEGENFDYEKVILFYCLNDIYFQQSLGDINGSESKMSGIKDFLKSYSYAYIWLKGVVSDRSEVYFNHDLAIYQNDERSIENLNLKLQAIRSLADKFNFEVSLIAMPYEYQIRSDGAEIRLPQEKLKSLTNQHSISFYDAYEQIKAGLDYSQEGYLYADGIHFSKKGHNIMSRFVVEQKIIE